MRKLISEILEEVNENPDKLAEYAGDVQLTKVFEYAFLKDHKMNLPDGTPPFKPDPCPKNMSPSKLANELRRLYVFQREDISDLRREAIFIGMLESIHPEEAAVLIAIKDQKLHKLYKNITWKRVAEAGFVNHPMVKSTKE